MAAWPVGDAAGFNALAGREGSPGSEWILNRLRPNVGQPAGKDRLRHKTRAGGLSGFAGFTTVGNGAPPKREDL